MVSVDVLPYFLPTALNSFITELYTHSTAVQLKSLEFVFSFREKPTQIHSH